jgi:hypothetical protein
VAQAMLHGWITPVDDGGNDLLVPEEKASIASIRIEHKVQAHVIPFALHTINATPLAPKSHPFAFAHTDAIGGLIGAGRQGLGHRGVNVVSDPGDASMFGVFMQVVLRKVMLFAERRKGLSAFLFF